MHKTLRTRGVVLALCMLVLGACRTPGSVEPSAQDSDLRFYGTDNRRAILSFETTLIFLYPEDWNGSAEALLTSDHREKIDEQIQLQIAHSFAAFTTHPEFVEAPGVTENNPQVTIVSATKIPGQRAARIKWTFRDTAVFHKKVFANGNREVKFWLPAEVTGIYRKGFRPGGRKNFCTDSHYNSEGDFWYFWNPFQENCPIVPERDLVRVTGTLQPLNSTTNTFPDYNRLYGSNGNRRTLKVVALIGIDESFRSGDLGRQSYRDMVNLLTGNGFRIVRDTPRMKKMTFPAQREFDLDMVVQLIDPSSDEFAELTVDALETADIFLYSGHSGLGGHLAPERLEDAVGRRLRMPRDKYQILLFQGCSTFAYYNRMFFDMKRTTEDQRGSANLDILTTGIGLSFDVGPRQDFALLQTLITGERPSWQVIVDRLLAIDPNASALTHINGDEDNPRAAR